MEELKRITVKVPESLHYQVKVKAAIEGTTVSDVLRNYLVEWVRDDTPEDEGDELPNTD